MVAAAFQDVPKPHQIGLNVSHRVFNRVSDASLGRQVDHLLRIVFSESCIDSSTILQICFDQLKRAARALCSGFKLGNPGSLECRVVVGVDVVKPHHCLPLVEQACAEMKPNKTSSTGNENSHKFPLNKKDNDRKLINFAWRQQQLPFNIYHTKSLSRLRQQ